MNHTVPDSLVRYQQALDEAIRRDLAGAAVRRRRRVGIRFVLAAGAAAAVGLGALSLLVRGAPSTATPAAAAIIRHAAAALAQAPGTILHIKFTALQDNGDGTTVSWTQESFSEERAPYDSRLVNERLPGTPPGVEQATVNGVPQVYDPTRNTIYIGPAPSNMHRQLSQYRFSPGPAPGTYRVRTPTAYRVRMTGPARDRVRAVDWRTVTVTAGQAKALRNGTDIIVFKRQGKDNRITGARVVQASRPPANNASNLDPFSATFRRQILALLRSGHVALAGHATVDGRDTIKIQSADGHTTYYLAPHSYTPVELTTKGSSGGSTMRFEIYQELPVSENSSMLSLTAQHPTAVIDRNVGDYQAAQARLFPHG